MWEGKTNTTAISLTYVGWRGFHCSLRIQVHRMWCTVTWLVFTNTSKTHSAFIFMGYMDTRTHSSWNPQPMKTICSFETVSPTQWHCTTHARQPEPSYSFPLSIWSMKSMVKCQLLRKIKVKWWMKIYSYGYLSAIIHTSIQATQPNRLDRKSDRAASLHLHLYCLTGLYCSHKSDT
jgi:hypothetical protein